MNQHEDFLQALQPLGAIEEELVWQLTVTSWRLDRAQRIETCLLQMEIDAAEQSSESVDYKLAESILASLSPTTKQKEKAAVNIGRVFRRLSIGQDEISHVLRYETAAERSFYRALHALERMQEKRKGNKVTPIEVIDLHIDGGIRV